MLVRAPTSWRRLGAFMLYLCHTVTAREAYTAKQVYTSD